MTTATPQRTRVPHRYTPPLSVRPAARSSHTNGGLYAYAANSPVCYTDPDGQNIILLLDPNGARVDPVAFGHAAALIGNDSDGWLYYSNDGKRTIDVQWFATKEDFFEGYKQTRTAPFTYREHLNVSTTSEQDMNMQVRAFELAGIDRSEGFALRTTGERLVVTEHQRPSPYNILGNNCSEHVAEIARAGALISAGEVIPKTMFLCTAEDYEKLFGSPYTNF